MVQKKFEPYLLACFCLHKLFYLFPVPSIPSAHKTSVIKTTKLLKKSVNTYFSIASMNFLCSSFVHFSLFLWMVYCFLGFKGKTCPLCEEDDEDFCIFGAGSLNACEDMIMHIQFACKLVVSNRFCFKQSVLHKKNFEGQPLFHRTANKVSRDWGIASSSFARSCNLCEQFANRKKQKFVRIVPTKAVTFSQFDIGVASCVKKIQFTLKNKSSWVEIYITQTGTTSAAVFKELIFYDWVTCVLRTPRKKKSSKFSLWLNTLKWFNHRKRISPMCILLRRDYWSFFSGKENTKFFIKHYW